MPPSRFALAVMLAASSVLLIGCYVPAPVTHAVLRVSAAGAYALDGVDVAADGLPDALAHRHAVAPTLLVEIDASPQANANAVTAALKAAKSAHVRVAFASRLSAQ